MRSSVSVLASLVGFVAIAAACSAPNENDSSVDPNGTGASADGGGTNGGGGDDTGVLPFAPDAPDVYVAKVKNALVGEAPTDAELKAVVADPAALGGLVDGWMKMPAYQTKMQRFFELAFQQTQITAADFGDMLQPGQLQLDGNTSTAAIMLQSLQESFARTMVNDAMAGAPFNQAMSTQTYALTTALKVFYALLDVWQIDDSTTGLHDYFAQANPSMNIYATAATVPLSATLQKGNAQYMHWTVPAVASLGGPAGCQTDPVVIPARANELYMLLMGIVPGRKLADGTQCPGGGGKTPGPLTMADFSDWTMTSIRQPAAGETPTAFYDLQTLRGGTQMVLKRPYVGFFTTPAFFANWQTNASNQMRVTINQTLIVALGSQVDGSDTMRPSSTPGLDATHSATPDCAHCHETLDPTRSILASTFSWNYGSQLDATFGNQRGLFAFRGTEAPMSSVYDLAKTLSTHPMLAPGWVQKLCYWIDSEACDAGDPEYQKLVSLFQSSNYSFNQLVKAVVMSPITTHTVSTSTATTNGEVVAVARRDHLCAAWNARLGLADACGLDATKTPVLPSSALNVIAGLPSDGYGRGSVAPVLPNEPTLFFRGATENLCEAIAAVVIDDKTPPAGAKTWSSAQPDAAIADFVAIVMGLPPSDPRAAAALGVLQKHFADAKATSGITPTDALRSTFTAACMSPSALSMGM